LVGSIKDPQVYVVENEMAELRKIVVGSEFGTKLMVLQGLKEGEVVVVNGQDNLKDNVKVNVIK
jgi:multidrug efflux pump subunit AcrA (membrane-fusion protein)